MKQAIIIGAGPAGLTAAYELLQQSQDYQVTIIEASNTIGGISRTVQYHGNRMDIGGHRFFSKDERVMKWWERVLPLQGEASMDDAILGRKGCLKSGGPNPNETDEVMLVRRRVSRIYYKKKFFDYPVSMKPQTFINMGFVQSLKAGFSYLVSSVHKLPEDNLENFYINRFGRVLYAMFFEGYTEKLWGRHPREISADWGAQRVKGLSILALIRNLFPSKEKETSLIEEFWYPKYGPGQLWETVAKDIEQMGGKILYNSKVTHIQSEENVIQEVIYEKEGREVRMPADVVFSTMPVQDLVKGMTPQPSLAIREIGDGLPYRDFVTVGLLLDKLQLKNKTNIPTINNIVPDCWIYVQDVGVKMGRIQIFNNWSPYLVKEGKHKVWIGLEYFCKEGDKLWNMSKEDFVQLAVNELISMGIINSQEDVLDSHREKVKKAYPAYFDTYSQMDTLVKHLNGYKNLYCIGRNGQHRYNNMDHSMVTAFEAVNNLLGEHPGEDKSSIWNINTEKEYHEAKQEKEQ